MNKQTIQTCDTREQLLDIINSLVKSNQYTKIRFFERNRSIEDFSVSYTLAGTPIFNFIINSTPSGSVVVRKRNKNSTRHIRFDISKACTVTVKKHIIEVRTVDEIYYIDGTHRYNK